MSTLELIAVIVSVLGVWLTARRSLWNFPWSLASVSLYALLFWRVKLYADMLLQGIFALILLYGWWRWLRGRSAAGQLLIERLRVRDATVGAGSALLIAVPLGWFLAAHTDAALPWLDSALLAASVVANLGAARRILEHWWLWIGVDLIYIGVYVYKSLWLTALLYGLFVLLAAYGLRTWRDALRLQRRGLTT